MILQCAIQHIQKSGFKEKCCDGRKFIKILSFPRVACDLYFENESPSLEYQTAGKPIQ
jgi:hypothetical protein